MKTITKKFIIKNWDELNDEEKEIQKKKYDEHIWDYWSDYIYDSFLNDIEYLKSELKYIYFDKIFIKENSQSIWIDSFKNFECKISYKTKNIFDIEFNKNKYIENITYIEIDNDWVSIDELRSKNGYKILAQKLEKEFDYFKNELNKILYDYYNDIYDIPDDFIDEFFNGMEFEFEMEE